MSCLQVFSADLCGIAAIRACSLAVLEGSGAEWRLYVFLFSGFPVSLPVSSQWW